MLLPLSHTHTHTHTIYTQTCMHAHTHTHTHTHTHSSSITVHGCMHSISPTGSPIPTSLLNPTARLKSQVGQSILFHSESEPRSLRGSAQHPVAFPTALCIGSSLAWNTPCCSSGCQAHCRLRPLQVASFCRKCSFFMS